MARDSLLARTPLQHRSRALAKTLGYRGLMILITFLVALVFTDDLAVAANIGIVTNLVKTVTYYGHERLWDRIAWGLETPRA